jgi:hypothetical protein
VITLELEIEERRAKRGGGMEATCIWQIATINEVGGLF